MMCAWPLSGPPECPDPGVHAWWNPQRGDFGLCGLHDAMLASNQRLRAKRDAELEEYGDVGGDAA